MKYADASAFRQALETRLLAQSGGGGNAARDRLRKLVIFDRLLARMLVIAPGRWVVKGGVSLDYRLGDRARLTNDIDLAYQDPVDVVTESLLVAVELEMGDFFSFRIVKSFNMDFGDEGVAYRYKEVTMDIGVNDRSLVDAEMLRLPDILGFAGLPVTEVPALAIETHLAEKLHAYVQIRPDGRMNTRVKDLVDMVLIHDHVALNAEKVRRALLGTFWHRIAEVPASLPAPPAAWATSYRQLALSVGIDPNVHAGYRLAQELFDPILAGCVSVDSVWSPDERQWIPPV